MDGQWILVVDDDPSLREVLRDGLALWGYQATSGSGLEDALARLSEGSFQAVVSDIHMPLRDGFELLAAVRARWPDPPVVLMSAYPTSDTEKQALEAGAAGFLSKPFPLDALRGALKSALAPLRARKP